MLGIEKPLVLTRGLFFCLEEGLDVCAPMKRAVIV